MHGTKIKKTVLHI